MSECAEKIVVAVQDDALEVDRARAEGLAQRLGAPLVLEQNSREAPRLLISENRIELLAPDMKPGRGVTADFRPVNVQPGRKQPLARAIGTRTRTVIDATAGLGQDAFLLACLGYDVTAIERSPVIFALLEDGVRRACEDERLSAAMGDRLRVMQGDARELLARGELPRADAIYIDPMFPPKRKASALPRKEIQTLRMAVGDDPDAGELLEIALGVAQRRVIVKRPAHAPPLREGATTSHERKLVRYDVWVIPGPPARE